MRFMLNRVIDMTLSMLRKKIQILFLKWEETEAQTEYGRNLFISWTTLQRSDICLSGKSIISSSYTARQEIESPVSKSLDTKKESSWTGTASAP